MNFKCRLHTLITMFSYIRYISMVIIGLVRLTKKQYESDMRRRSCPRPVAGERAVKNGVSQIWFVWKSTK